MFMILVLQMTADFSGLVKCVDAEDYEGVYLWCMMFVCPYFDMLRKLNAEFAM
jgi:hypothetical protein